MRSGRRASPEKRIEGRIIRALRQLGFAVTKLSQPRRTMQTIGTPDLYASHGVWLIRCWIEVKAPGNKPTTAQLAWHRYEREAGGTVIVATSVEDVLRGIAELGAPIEVPEGSGAD